MNDLVECIKAHNGISISARTLSKSFGIPEATIRKMINLARSEGYPICSCSKGYYYSKDNKEIEKTILSLSHRIGSMQRAILGLSTCLGGINEV